MKFLVVSDLHRKKSDFSWINEEIRSSGAEAVLVLGDVTDFGSKKLVSEILSSIDSKVYAIPGNCDPLDFSEGVPESAADMHGKAVCFGDYRLVGLGGSNVTIFGTPFELKEDEIYSRLKEISSEGMILMTHAPSYGILDHIPNGTSVGSPAVLKIVEEFRPVLALSGHIHEDFGVVEKNGTVFVNPGPAKDKRFAVVKIENGKVEAELRKH
ncbi:MAG: metallophosphoesterase family protein [Candidatus Methanomethylophilaceae archaeon]|nr:metallophosphoesterase family protein [Candidatus Methanomethylophilaceae archaeon]